VSSAAADIQNTKTCGFNSLHHGEAIRSHYLCPITKSLFLTIALHSTSRLVAFSFSRGSVPRTLDGRHLMREFCIRAQNNVCSRVI